MDENFLLTTSAAQSLYHECAEALPVIDYHNHLNVRDLSEKRRFKNLTQLWLAGDPYKHRAMRICGVAEKYITGEASEYEKFEAWMDSLPKLIGNPLYDWSVLEMKRVFGISLIPGDTKSRDLWEETGKQLANPEFTAPGLLKKFHVEYASPCASLTENLEPFATLSAQEALEERSAVIAPSLRGDTLTGIDRKTITELEQIIHMTILTLEDFFCAIEKRLEAFEQAGCRFSDHALDNGFVYYKEDGKNEERFRKLQRECSFSMEEKHSMEEVLSPEDRGRLFSAVLRFLAASYAKRGWTMQLHIGAQRSTSTRLRRLAGPAGGFAGIGNGCDVQSLTDMLDDFEKGKWGMPRIILFTLNPADNAVMSVLSGSYSQDGVSGKITQGPAWWWCDHLYGMREVFENNSAFGVLSVFAGMTTDSRSFLSFVRHEYFRRALCGWIGEKVEKGEMIASDRLLKNLVQDVCYKNAKKLVS